VWDEDVHIHRWPCDFVGWSSGKDCRSTAALDDFHRGESFRQAVRGICRPSACASDVMASIWPRNCSGPPSRSLENGPCCGSLARKSGSTPRALQASGIRHEVIEPFVNRGSFSQRHSTRQEWPWAEAGWPPRHAHRNQPGRTEPPRPGRRSNGECGWRSGRGRRSVAGEAGEEVGKGMGIGCGEWVEEQQPHSLPPAKQGSAGAAPVSDGDRICPDGEGCWRIGMHRADAGSIRHGRRRMRGRSIEHC